MYYYEKSVNFTQKDENMLYWIYARCRGEKKKEQQWGM